MSRRRNPNAGLFAGWWLTPDLKRKVRRLQRNEYPELYRLWHKHQDIRLGVHTPIGTKPGYLR